VARSDNIRSVRSHRQERGRFGGLFLLRARPSKRTMRSRRTAEIITLSLSETQSCWQLISNRAMLLPYARGL